MDDADVTSQPFAPIVEQFGMRCELADNDQVTAMIIIVKTIDFESGDVALGYYRSKGLDWIDARGMIATAQDIVTTHSDERGILNGDDEDDD